jgi:hypothetical protein
MTHSHRDLGTEGAGDADIVLRKCLSGANALIPGPRYFCANRAIVSTGSYGRRLLPFWEFINNINLLNGSGPRGVHHLNMDGVEGMTGAEVADGKEGCRAAVRRQIGAGADWIKVSNYTLCSLYYSNGFRSRYMEVILHSISNNC